MCFVALKKRSNVKKKKVKEYPKSNGATVHIPFMTTRPDLVSIRDHCERSIGVYQ